MATSSAVTGANPLNCLLCWNVYNIPRSLPCKHTFCEECLSSYIDSAGIRESDSDKYFECPACRYFVKVPDTNASATDISKSFQLNALYKSVSRYHNTAGTHCDVCLGDNETETANAWCIECGEALCTDCRVAHKKVRQTKKHQVIDLEDAFHNVLAYSRSNEECTKHPETMLELFCLNHKELCCALCVPTLHNGCRNIRSLDDIAKRVEKHRDRTSFIQEFKNMKTDVMSI
ncbi:E3 ubiquitin-protein ligase TRIM56 [Mizuhopecten yessoensis]|uniref:E3 ubiquitin-protein ligase TRIM56 n=1 Tax=Mizuhopecten yessoensis TaxID=6573 RepID=A0A210PZ03_MIZYE|nr:E3 ubiquitin-protein ligase TRIM56 [Mizuhopecten yessoensis]